MRLFTSLANMNFLAEFRRTDARFWTGSAIMNGMVRYYLATTLVGILAVACSPATTAIPAPPTIASELTATSQPTPIPLPSGTPPSTFVCFTTNYDPQAFLPDGRVLLAGASDGVQLFSLQTMQAVKFFKSPGILNGPSLALSPDGDYFVWAFDNGTLQAIRLSDQSVIYDIQSGQTGLIKLEFSPSGDHLYSAANDGTVKVWDQQGKLLQTLQPGAELLNIGISPDEKTLATIPFDGPVLLWDLDEFKLQTELSGSGGYDTSDVVFSMDGQYLAADLATGLFLWQITDGTEILGSVSPINSMAVVYSPDGKYLAYSDNNNVILSSPDGSQVIRALEGEHTPIYGLFFSPDSSLLVAVDDRAIRIWGVEDGNLLAVGKDECP